MKILNIFSATLSGIGTEYEDFSDFNALDPNAMSEDLLYIYNKLNEFKLTGITEESETIENLIDAKIDETTKNIQKLILENFSDDIKKTVNFSDTLLKRIINLSKDKYTIQEVIDLLNDPNSELY
jgi:hypothetical protein